MRASTVKSIKTALKARYAARRPSIENASYDLFSPARIYQWRAAIHRVRTVYANEHNGRKPRLLRPRRFTEKIQWRKLVDLNPIYAVTSDKLAVRDFIAKRVGAHVLAPLLWVGNAPTAVSSTHSILRTSSRARLRARLMVRQRQEIDADAAVAKFKDWLGTCYGTIMDEPICSIRHR